ncbi:hypothetical protein CERSUDRAFT_91436 [Gelatoporia subvermispora B]|uniref:Uncharacterized protein n=1 Tax=Ceriporiopsis subvermispora (strain B) TaxID=914234 RepID=M2QUF2_CERS8|nr:hypothetical protein CERSUDRAFT_91436 [Gelatoporia subvermispora B]
MADPAPSSPNSAQGVRFDIPEIIVSPDDSPEPAWHSRFIRNAPAVRVGMPVRSRVTRVIAAVFLIICAIHFTLRYLPDSIYTFNIMQTSVAMLALASLSFLVLTHHKRNGLYLTSEQEEWIFIGAFGLFWLATIVAWRAWNRAPAEVISATMTDAATVAGAAPAKAVARPGIADRRKQWPCSSDAVYCVVEEWSYY